MPDVAPESSPQTIYVKDSQGQLGTIAANEAPQAIQQGQYTLASPADIHASQLRQQYGSGILNPIKAFGEAALGQATFGVSRQLENKFGITTPEAQAARAKYNPDASTLGDVTGIIAPLLVPEVEGLGALNSVVNPIKGVSKIGQAVEKSLAPAAGEVAQNVAGRILQKGVPKFAGSAVEGAAFGLGQSVNEDALGDPSAMGEKLLSNIGLNALFAGGVGTALGLPSILRKGTPEAIVQGIENEAGQTFRPEQMPSDGTVEASLDALDIDPGKKKSILDALQKKKPGAEQLEKDGALLGVPVIESQLSASKQVHDWDSYVINSPSPIGVARSNLVAKQFEGISKAVQDALATGSNLSEADTGNLVKKGLTETFEAERAPIDDLYSTIKKDTNAIPLNPRSIGQVANTITKIEGVKLSPSSPEFRLAKSVASEIKNLKTVDDLQAYQKILSRRTIGNPELKFVAGQIQEKLARIEENHIVDFAQKMYVPESEAGKAVADLVQRISDAKSQYKVMREKMNWIGELTGKRKVYGPQDFLNHIQDVSPEKLTQKLFAKGNSEFLSFFKEQFPTQFQALADFQKNKIASGAMKDGRLLPGPALKELDKLSPEVKNLLFTPQDLEKMQAGNRLLEAFPPSINPSRTAIAQRYDRFISNPISAIVETGKDAAALAFVKRMVGSTGEEAPKLKALLELEKTAQAFSKKVTSKTKAIFQPQSDELARSKTAIIALTADERKKSKEKAQQDFKDETERVLNFSQSPEMLQESLENSTQDLYSHAPNITAALQQAAVNQLQFLASKVPQYNNVHPMSKDPVPNQTEIFKFNQYVNILKNPTLALDQIKTGTLSPETVEALQTVRPKLYQEMSQQLVEEMTNAKARKTEIPYQRRLMLSMFLHQDMDGSITPQAIQTNQFVFNSPSNQSQAMQGNPKRPQASAGKITLSSRALTPQQASAQREQM